MIKENDKFLPSCLFEGMTSVRAILKANENGSNDRKIIEILYSDAKKTARAKELNYLSKIASAHGFVLTECPDSEINALAVGSSHGGILARCSERTIPALSSDRMSNVPENGFFVLLDGIEDPYNFGYSLRSVYAAGADGIILPPRNWLTAAGVVARASAGASELFSMYMADTLDAIHLFKERGYKIVCADKPNSVSLYDADLKKPVFLIVGGEKRGISAPALKEADSIVRIDYGRDFPASLSAASASTIIAYEVFRQNMI